MSARQRSQSACIGVTNRSVFSLLSQVLSLRLAQLIRNLNLSHLILAKREVFNVEAEVVNLNLLLHSFNITGMCRVNLMLGRAFTRSMEVGIPTKILVLKVEVATLGRVRLY